MPGRWTCRTLPGAIVASFLCATAIAGPPPQVAVCAACHGADGLGNQAAGYPALAGLPAPYIARQLDAFVQGTRINPVMKQMAGTLTPAQRKQVAGYYAAMKIPARPAPNPMPAGEGARLAMDGAWGGKLTGLPACDSCHGPQGIGVGDVFPRLAGQPAAYLEAQLGDWQSGSRKNDPLHLMRNVAGKLSAAQIKAVAAYYAALPANPSHLAHAHAATESK